jgi:hypothetical protein
MGILDDAIREHLELKRAHGASDDEVARKEAEVFGPVRQQVAAQPLEGDATQMLHPADVDALETPGPRPPAAPEPEAAAPAHDLEPEPLQPSTEDAYAVHPGDHPVPDPHDHAHPAASDPAWAEDTEFFSEPAAPPAPPPPDHDQHPDEPHPALRDHDAIHSEEHPPEPVFREQAAPPAAPDPPVVPPPIEEPPVEEPPLEPPPVEEPPVRAPGEDDVLEETPEFLQDAPEHDRLWFEQKPPRDFDFGE